jgi:hypothetical protein
MQPASGALQNPTKPIDERRFLAQCIAEMFVFPTMPKTAAAAMKCAAWHVIAPQRDFRTS